MKMRRFGTPHPDGLSSNAIRHVLEPGSPHGRQMRCRLPRWPRLSRNSIQCRTDWKVWREPNGSRLPDLRKAGSGRPALVVFRSNATDSGPRRTVYRIALPCSWGLRGMKHPTVCVRPSCMLYVRRTVLLKWQSYSGASIPVWNRAILLSSSAELRNAGLSLPKSLRARSWGYFGCRTS